MKELSILQQREKLARAAMQLALEDQQAEDSVDLYIQHHLEEIETEYWVKHFGTPSPTPLQVLDALVLEHEGDDEEIEAYEMLDFSLPDQVTNYVICVSFDSHGQVIDISMES
ncbi:DUF2004 domain-containing protein [Acinetobacter venetianus]|jgi:hypothetical protein|uniref:DUF2004 domain-containing protein n=1 Tax=Acinetobacter venetianus TaxID=52133 RepID=UPI000AE793A1